MLDRVESSVTNCSKHTSVSSTSLKLHAKQDGKFNSTESESSTNCYRMQEETSTCSTRLHYRLLRVLLHITVGDFSSAQNSFEALQHDLLEIYSSAEGRLTSTSVIEKNASIIGGLWHSEDPLVFLAFYHLVAVSCKRPCSLELAKQHIRDGLEVVGKCFERLQDTISTTCDSSTKGDTMTIPLLSMQDLCRCAWLRFAFLEHRVYIQLSEGNNEAALESIRLSLSTFLSFDLHSTHAGGLGSVLASLGVYATLAGISDYGKDYLQRALVASPEENRALLMLFLAANLLQGGQVDEVTKIVEGYGSKLESDESLLIRCAYMYITSLHAMLLRGRNSIGFQKGYRSNLLNCIDASTPTLNVQLRARCQTLLSSDALSLGDFEMAENFLSAAVSSASTIRDAHLLGRCQLLVKDLSKLLDRDSSRQEQQNQLECLHYSISKTLSTIQDSPTRSETEARPTVLENGTSSSSRHQKTERFFFIDTLSSASMPSSDSSSYHCGTGTVSTPPLIAYDSELSASPITSFSLTDSVSTPASTSKSEQQTLSSTTSFSDCALPISASTLKWRAEKSSESVDPPLSFRDTYAATHNDGTNEITGCEALCEGSSSDLVNSCKGECPPEIIFHFSLRRT